MERRALDPAAAAAHARAGEALVLLYPNALVLDHAGADFAGGRLLAKGRIELPDAGEPSYRFEATARSLSLRWPAGWLLRGDGDLTLASTAEGRQLRGEVRLERAFYLQDIKLSPTQLARSASWPAAASR